MSTSENYIQDQIDFLEIEVTCVSFRHKVVLELLNRRDLLALEPRLQKTLRDYSSMLVCHLALLNSGIMALEV